MNSSARSARKARPALAARILAIHAAQKPANLPLAEKFLRTPAFRACSETLNNFAQGHRRRGERRIPPPSELLPPIF